VLEEIRIRGLGVIEDAVIALSPGLTVVTGETGAGKTMIVTSIGLLLGQRADASLATADRPAAVEGRLALPRDHPAVVRAMDAGADLDEDGRLLVARTVTAEGRSRAHVGGRSVPASVLTEMADDLVAVHGQSEQVVLRQPGRQRDLLDRFAGPEHAAALERYRDVYARHRAATEALQALAESARERAQEADLLRFGLAELDQAAIAPGEDERVDAELARLQHAEALRSAADLARLALAGSDEAAAGGPSASGAVNDARAALTHAAGHDHRLDELAERVRSVAYEIDDIASELAAYAREVDDDPRRLAELQDRRAQLSSLLRKYGPDVDSLLEWQRSAADRLANLDGADERIDALTAETAGLRAELSELAAALTAHRTSAAHSLAAAVSAELADLAMPDARVGVEITQQEHRGGLEIGGRELAFGPTGVDSVEFLLAPHAGATARPLARSASGGELSRVMLGLEVTLAGADPVPTFVFDEVDAGIGGRAAVEVGARLARLATTAQVVVVTHLPQVAAFADAHLVVRKSAAGFVTASSVEHLDEAGRERELSRMLAGLEGSASAQAHAAELRATAQAAKASRG
jgi:DNA repair protein RecN (Recombination protein N)